MARALASGVLRLPTPVVTALAGRRPPEIEGQRLDPQINAIIAAQERLGFRPLETLTPERAREEYARRIRLVDAAPRPMAHVETLAIPGPAQSIPARLYVPEGAPAPGPALVYYHGGGWVIGGLTTHDASCRALADRSGARVLSVDYRLAPEHRFPAGWEDALAAWRWVADDPSRIGAVPGRLAVGGDSAGGNLAAGVSLAARHHAMPLPTFQLLIYPGVDLTCAMPSHRTFGEGFLLTRRLLSWFLGLYLRDPSDARDPRASPLFTDDLAGVPPAYVVTAGFDPLRDEGRRYADRLRDAGVPVRYENHPGLPHGFVTMTGASTASRAALDACADVLRRAV